MARRILTLLATICLILVTGPLCYCPQMQAGDSSSARPTCCASPAALSDGQPVDRDPCPHCDGNWKNFLASGALVSAPLPGVFFTPGSELATWDVVPKLSIAPGHLAARNHDPPPRNRPSRLLWGVFLI